MPDEPDRPGDRSSASPSRSPRLHDRRAERAEAERSYTLDDLTAQTGVTVRTVRYYISEGLLPPPHGAGPGTRYTRRHLDRLLLIGALKDAYLPLKEIRRRIAAMTDAEIHEAVEQVLSRSGETPAQDNDVDAVASVMMAPPPDDRAGRSSAASYIEAVLRDQTREGSVPRAAVRLPPGPMRFPGANEPIDPVGQVGPVETPDTEPAQWRRLAISPEAELLIEEATYGRRKDQIEALVAWARRILTTA